MRGTTNKVTLTLDGVVVESATARTCIMLENDHIYIGGLPSGFDRASMGDLNVSSSSRPVIKSSKDFAGTLMSLTYAVDDLNGGTPATLVWSSADSAPEYYTSNQYCAGMYVHRSIGCLVSLLVGQSVRRSIIRSVGSSHPL